MRNDIDTKKALVLSMLPIKHTALGSHLWDAVEALIEEKKVAVTFIDGGPSTLTRK